LQNSHPAAPKVTPVTFPALSSLQVAGTPPTLIVTTGPEAVAEATGEVTDVSGTPRASAAAETQAAVCSGEIVLTMWVTVVCRSVVQAATSGIRAAAQSDFI
jgi:hypothetical protein